MFSTFIAHLDLQDSLTCGAGTQAIKLNAAHTNGQQRSTYCDASF